MADSIAKGEKEFDQVEHCVEPLGKLLSSVTKERLAAALPSDWTHGL